MLVETPDGRALQVLDSGGHGIACVFHHGTPGGPVPQEAVVRAAADAGLRWIGYARPGYAASSPLPGRTVAQAAQDTATVLDHLGLQEFVTYGYSGGGPHALACAALLPDRCLAAATVAGLGPDGVEDLDLLAGMGEDNVEELTLARAGRSVLTPYLVKHAEGLREVTGAQLAAALGGLLSDADAAALTGEVAEVLAAGMREGLRVEVDGWLDDDLALVRPWGFDVAEIGVPVAVWQGAQDRMVPFHHGQWLVAHVPQAWGHLLPDDGHVSVVGGRLPEVLADLRVLADRG
jgi:pimeloyl-ACP methyl ester carboxylesterase